MIMSCIKELSNWSGEYSIFGLYLSFRKAKEKKRLAEEKAAAKRRKELDEIEGKDEEREKSKKEMKREKKDKKDKKKRKREMEEGGADSCAEE